jgi:hypothetical protein
VGIILTENESPSADDQQELSFGSENRAPTVFNRALIVCDVARQQTTPD